MSGAQEETNRHVIKLDITGLVRKTQDALLNLNFREIMTNLNMSYAIV